MNAFLAFLKKEWMEQVRSGRLTILLLLFILLGIMNPAFAKLTPWLMETMADSLASTGLTVSSVTIDASDSWTQFFKNIPISLLVFVLAVLMLFSAPASGSSTVLVGTGGVYLLSYVAGMFPAVKEYVPTYLTDTASLFAGVTKPEDYYCAIGIAMLLVAGSMVGSILLFNRKKI